MKTLTDQDRFEEFWETNKYSIHAGVSISKDTVQQIYNIALASQPTKWHDWSKEKPVVENEFGAEKVMIEYYFESKQNYTDCHITQLYKNWAEDCIRIAWHYILPSPFSVKPKSKAEVAWDKWAQACGYADPADEHYKLTQARFIEAYILGQKAGEK